mmetsp:Transcript_6172/g.14493  ORF Transcript_6172/g.14493 Transcript_6172/m.14493 type:complete len:220 (+) Transcript_6172:504-1163(+)
MDRFMGYETKASHVGVAVWQVQMQRNSKCTAKVGRIGTHFRHCDSSPRLCFSFLGVYRYSGSNSNAGCKTSRSTRFLDCRIPTEISEMAFSGRQSGQDTGRSIENERGNGDLASRQNACRVPRAYIDCGRRRTIPPGSGIPWIASWMVRDLECQSATKDLDWSRRQEEMRLHQQGIEGISTSWATSTTCLATNITSTTRVDTRRDRYRTGRCPSKRFDL